MKEQIVFFATGWGSKHGGINSFNFDLCVNLATFLEGYYQVVCVVQDIDFDINCYTDIPRNLKLVKSHEKEDAKRIIKNLKDETRGAPAIFIGHDVKTGLIAIECAKEISSKSVVIHHMNYLAYATYQSANAENTTQKTELQKMILSLADYVLAVGPSLHTSAKSLLQRAGKSSVNCFEIIPGLAEINPVSIPEMPQAVTYGRLDDDIVKQGKVAIGAFSKSIKDSSTPLFLIGVSDKNTYDEEFNQIYQDLQEFSATYSGKSRVNILPLPYKERELVFQELRVSSTSMMLSLHEGFGLAGWEAISAEVPLIISTNTGLYKFLYREFSHVLNCLHPVTISGDLETDINNVSDKLSLIFNDIEKQKKLARRLKEAINQYTWERACKTLILSCNLEKGKPFQAEERKLLDLKAHMEKFNEEIEALIQDKTATYESLSSEQKSEWLRRDQLWKQVKVGEFVAEDIEGSTSEITSIRRDFILKKRDLTAQRINQIYWLLNNHDKNRHGLIPKLLSKTNDKGIHPLSITFDSLIDSLGSENPELISPWNVYYGLYINLFKFPVEAQKFLQELHEEMSKEIEKNNRENLVYEWFKFRIMASLTDCLQSYKEVIDYIDIRLIDLDKRFSY